MLTINNLQVTCSGHTMYTGEVTLQDPGSMGLVMFLQICSWKLYFTMFEKSGLVSMLLVVSMTVWFHMYAISLQRKVVYIYS